MIIESLFDSVTENVYIGAAEASDELDSLQEAGITHVLVCGNDVNVSIEACDSLVCTTIDLPDSNSAPFLVRIPAAFSFINSAVDNGNKVIIVCSDGNNRSAAIILAWMMHRSKKTLFEVTFFFPSQTFCRNLGFF